MFSDVIAAVATPQGRSAIGIVRVSGSGSHEIAAGVLDPFRTTPLRLMRITSVVDRARHETIDRAMYATFGSPASYTGQDMVEVYTHGGLIVPAEVLNVFLSQGARLAQPGEFTRRAVLNGKMDLMQAEAIGDLIEATAPAQRRAALSQLDRGLSRRIEALREQVIALEAMVCYEIDFPEEDSGPVPPERIQKAIDDLAQAFRTLLSTAAEGERLREGAMAVVAGRPNAGKSSLFNALVGADRAIVTEVPGTTRDAIEAPITCGGFPFRLIDTAGLRPTGDKVERMGIEVSRRYLGRADVVLYCIDSARTLQPDERAFLDGLNVPAILVGTKCDLETATRNDPGVLPVSVVTGEGLDVLRDQLATLAFSDIGTGTPDDPLITRARHQRALQRALTELMEFGQTRTQGVEGAVCAVHLRAAVAALEDVIGLVTTDDVLDRVFQTFCVGK